MVKRRSSNERGNPTGSIEAKFLHPAKLLVITPEKQPAEKPKGRAATNKNYKCGCKNGLITSSLC